SDRITLDVAGGSAPTGVRVPQAGLNGSGRALLGDGFEGTRTVIPDWANIEAYVKTIRVPRAVTGLAQADVAAGRELFGTACAGCHGGDKWTVSRVFYTPGEANNNAQTGALRTRSWTLPDGFPAAAAAAPGTFRPTPVAVAGGNDQITCVLRNVGTMPPAGTVQTVSVLGNDEVELRQDMTTRGQG